VIGSKQKLAWKVARWLLVAIVIYLVAGLIDVAVFRLPATERRNYDVILQSQCQSLRAGMKLAEVEAIFDSNPFSFTIKRNDSTVEVRHRSTVCEVSLAAGTDLVATVTLKTGVIAWEE